MLQNKKNSCKTDQRIRTLSSFNRRSFLWNSAGGLGGIALAHLLGNSNMLAKASSPRPEWNGGLHHPARAKRVVQLFMSGAASQVDTFDYKPALIHRNGQAFDPGGKLELFQSLPGPVMKSPWEWKQHGECGKWMSSLLPHLAGCVDDIAFIPSMVGILLTVSGTFYYRYKIARP